jgi:hypothetical protein
VKRAGGWFLGLLIIAAMAGGGGLALRRVLHREEAAVLLLNSGRDPTDQALERGARWALEEYGGRAGQFKITLWPLLAGRGSADVLPQAAWIGSSEAVLIQGDVQPVPFKITAFDTHPTEPTGCFRISPGCEQQGRAAAAWAKKSRAARVFLIREAGSRRSEAIASAFDSAAQKLGIALAGELPTTKGPRLFDLVVAAKPDLVFYSGEEAPYSTAHQLSSALREKGYRGPFLMGEADPEVSFLATRPDLVEGTYLVSPFAPATPELARSMGSTPGPHVTAGYYAMKAILEAIDRADSIDPEDLRRAAARLPYFDAQGRAALRKCALYVAKGGTFEFVELLD